MIISFIIGFPSQMFGWPQQMKLHYSLGEFATEAGLPYELAYSTKCILNINSLLKRHLFNIYIHAD